DNFLNEADVEEFEDTNEDEEDEEQRR
ncbi:MAG: hypothetical protein JWQ09_1326, partial [Segetibacter sp.]|nr:hypothetical protein [Segetibacter sp.]